MCVSVCVFVSACVCAFVSVSVCVCIYVCLIVSLCVTVNCSVPHLLYIYILKATESRFPIYAQCSDKYGPIMPYKERGEQQTEVEL